MECRFLIWVFLSDAASFLFSYCHVSMHSDFFFLPVERRVYFDSLENAFLERIVILE